jgi:enoyl-CoA hydratase/carnithine racemase
VTESKESVSSGEGLIATERKGVLILQLDRPRSQNALTPIMIRSLAKALEDPSGRLGAVVIAGVGAHFCSGFDIGELESGSNPNERQEFSDTLSDIENFPVPVIAAVRGNCVGAGLDLALACDFRIADESALFLMPPAKLGIVYPWAGTQRLVTAVGPAWARMVLYTAEPIYSTEALAMGLVQRVVGEADLLEHVFTLASMIANERAPLSIEGLKETVRFVSQGPLSKDQIDHCVALVEGSLRSADHQEALLARREQRSPKFRHL